VTSLCCAFIVVLLCAQAADAESGAMAPTPNGGVLDLKQGRLRFEFVTGRIARVTVTREGHWSKTRSLMRVDVVEKPGGIEVV
jgi:hypothetical protein